jgi:hypothetical protein
MLGCVGGGHEQGTEIMLQLSIFFFNSQALKSSFLNRNHLPHHRVLINSYVTPPEDFQKRLINIRCLNEFLCI